MNELVYLGLSILEISKMVMSEFWSDYIKPKYQEKVILCYMDTGSFVIYIVTEDDFYKDIVADVEKRFHTLNCINVNRSLPIGKESIFLDLWKMN